MLSLWHHSLFFTAEWFPVCTCTPSSCPFTHRQTHVAPVLWLLSATALEGLLVDEALEIVIEQCGIQYKLL